MASVAEKVYGLVKETVEAQGVSLWDVRLVKEGASYYLRIFIDKPQGVSIDDCANVSHAIDPIIDSADPIEQSYYLEVCSAGLNRELVRDEHFYSVIGKTVTVKLFKALDGKKEITGVLEAFDGTLTVREGETVYKLERSQVAKASLFEEWE